MEDQFVDVSAIALPVSRTNVHRSSVSTKLQRTVVRVGPGTSEVPGPAEQRRRQWGDAEVRGGAKTSQNVTLGRWWGMVKKAIRRVVLSNLKHKSQLHFGDPPVLSSAVPPVA